MPAKNTTTKSVNAKTTTAKVEKTAPAKPTKNVEMKGGKTAPKSKVASKSTRATTKPAGEEGKKRRFFKIKFANGESQGRYVGQTPKQAASKGFTKMLREYKKSGKKIPASTNIYLQESTSGSHKKTYAYKARPEKLDEPQILTVVDKKTGAEKQITYNYRNKIHRIPVPEDLVTRKASKNATKRKQSTSEKPARKAAAKPAAKATGKASSKSAAKPVTKAAVKAKPASKAATKPVSKAASKPAAKKQSKASA